MNYPSRGNCDHVDHERGLQDHQVSKPSSAPLVEHSSYEHLLPQFFIVRPSSTIQTASGTASIKRAMVPLIPVDQLPPWLEIVGVPRELDIEQTKGSKNLGEVRKMFSFYEVYLPPREFDLNAHGLPKTTTKNQRKLQSPGSSSETQTRRIGFVDTTRHNKIPKDNSRLIRRASQRQDNNDNIKFHDRSHMPPDSNGSGTGSIPLSSTLPLNSEVSPLVSLTPPNTPQSPKSDPVNSELISPPDHPEYRLLNNSMPSSGGGHSPAQPYSLRSAGITPHRDTNDNDTPPGVATQSNSHCRGTSTGIVYCRHFAHHGTCKWGRACFYVHGMPQTVEGLREVGLQNIPAWYKSQQTGFAMGLAMARRWGVNYNHFVADPTHGRLAMMDGIGLMDAGIADMEGGAAMTQKEWNELRARLEKQDAAEQRGKAARDKHSGRVGKSKPKEKTREDSAKSQAALLSETEYHLARGETLEARLRLAEKDRPDLEIQTEAEGNKCNGQGKGKMFLIEENLIDL